ncbi:MAG: virulence protein [Lachnospiraceae bacterium]|jgi:hypothetical protein|nr:virulence protein [Lachnospiraceae bacterium]MCH4033759.1 virulence protein [Lachnospiraceae bacterium]MCH4067068.1 virulence protein [Lachnospiraceae bacterium]MCH4113093.1 virulence protein [Lachnospiraceae bacterium]MCI1354023.1 virulence protein [Lachnospiraceae bacterium]
MKLTFNVTKENKKAFAKAIGAITGEKAVYQFTPTYAFQIGDLTVNRDATLTATDDKDLRSLLEALKAQGYELLETEGALEDKPLKEAPAADEKPEALEEAPKLTVSLPLTAANVGTLTNILSSKGDLIRHALGVTDLRINVTEDKIEFPWFIRELTADETQAYTTFLSLLCKFSKELKHASSRPVETDNEKYAFRCFLLRLGFIGPDYKEARKILLQNLTGNSAFRNGAPVKVESTEAQKQEASE